MIPLTNFTEMNDHIRILTSPEAELARTLNSYKHCHICDAPAVVIKYRKYNNALIGNFVGFCEKHRKDTQ